MRTVHIVDLNVFDHENISRCVSNSINVKNWSNHDFFFPPSTSILLQIRHFFSFCASACFGLKHIWHTNQQPPQARWIYNGIIAINCEFCRHFHLYPLSSAKRHKNEYKGEKKKEFPRNQNFFLFCSYLRLVFFFNIYWHVDRLRVQPKVIPIQKYVIE